MLCRRAGSTGACTAMNSARWRCRRASRAHGTISCEHWRVRRPMFCTRARRVADRRRLPATRAVMNLARRRRRRASRAHDHVACHSLAHFACMPLEAPSGMRRATLISSQALTCAATISMSSMSNMCSHCALAAPDTTCSTPPPLRAPKQLDSNPMSPPSTTPTWKCCQSNPCCNHDVPQLRSKQSSHTSIATHPSTKAMAARVPHARATPSQRHSKEALTSAATAKKKSPAGRAIHRARMLDG